MCVYGLLPAQNASALDAPANGKAQILRGNLTLTWDAVHGARTYRVMRTSSLEPQGKTIATGLTAPKFVEPVAEHGESSAYTIVAVGQNGVGAASAPVKVAPRKAIPVEQ
jgi:hypothetical protein